MATVTADAARRPRAYVRVQGPDAGDYPAADGLERRRSPARVCEALLLTAKARVIAPLVVWRAGRRRLPAPHRARARRGRPRAPDADALRGEVRDRARGARLDASSSAARRTGSRTPTTAGRRSRCSTRTSTSTLDDADLERLRIEAGTPRFGRELDDRVLPAETGLVERAVSFTKGCYPGQEPIARQHHRGKVNRAPARARARRRPRRAGDARLLRRQGGRPHHQLGARARARLRPRRGAGRRRARRSRDSRPATLTRPDAPVAQGIERCPAEAEVASSNLAGRIWRRQASPDKPRAS